MRWALILMAGLLAALATAADLSKIDRTIRKEPAYAGKPKYCLLVFGPEARDRVWLVHDGDTLYVDRNGDGDLTEPGKKVAASKDEPWKSDGHAFEIGDLAVGGKLHKGQTLGLASLKREAKFYGEVDVVRDALKADPEGIVASMGMHVQSDRFKGVGVGGRIWQIAGSYDPSGVLKFSESPADAPIVHFDGPLAVTFYREAPTLRLARDNDVVLGVGSPGYGAGTFAYLVYEDTIPAGLSAKLEVRWPGLSKKELFELKDWC